MAKGAGRAFPERPAIRDRRAPSGADLRVPKPRMHANDRIVARDVVAADQPEQTAAGEREARAARLATDERVRVRRDSAEQAREPLAFEVMHEQVREHDADALRSRPR